MKTTPDWWSRDSDEVRIRFLTDLEKRFPKQEVESIKSALDFADKAHQGQLRKGEGGPYIVHPLRVAISLIDEFGYGNHPNLANLLKAALLHDTLEDSPSKPETLRPFGQEVVVLVQALTREAGEKRGEDGDQPDSAYLERIRQAGENAVVLKLADKIDNLRDAQFLEDPKRIRLYVKETYHSYLPLLDVIRSPESRNRIERVCLTVLSVQFSRSRPDHLRALIGHVKNVLPANSSRAVPVDEIADHKRALTVTCLLNPDLRTWIENDGISATRVSLTGTQLAARVCSHLAAHLESGECETLLELAGIPPSFASGSFRESWARVARQWKQIHGWLCEADCPPWFSELVRAEGNTPWLLLLVQSRLFQPPSWTLPLWYSDFGVELTPGLAELFPCFATAEPDAKLWQQALRFLLTNRLAVHRYLNGTGAATRLESVVTAGRELKLRPATLWAMRLASEYLELVSMDGAEPSASQVDLLWDKVWSTVRHSPFESGVLKESRNWFLEATCPPPLVRDTRDVEWDGLYETSALFEKQNLRSGFGNLLKLLLQQPATPSPKSRWIAFDHVEWARRSRFLGRPKAFAVTEHTSLHEMETAGVRLFSQSTPESAVLRVLPARSFALRDRLPEVTADDLKEIAAGQFSATAIFDRLLLKRWEDSSVQHLWVSRVYRILDSLEDLDPANVQTITVDFAADEPVPSFRAYLPMPLGHGDHAAVVQEQRKKIVARYIVAQVYNCAMARWLRKVRFSCSAVPSARASAAFIEAELAGKLAEAEKEGGYKARFGAYVDQFSFTPFGFTAEEQPAQQMSFTALDMRWGSFLGIDIGGQFIKFCLFEHGKEAEGSKDIGQIPTFLSEDKVPVQDFCHRVLTEITARLPGQTRCWERIDGVGISWPGAVRDNHIAGRSATLLRLIHRDGQAFSNNDEIARLPSFDLASEFMAELKNMAGKEKFLMKPGFTVALENDGNAEAFGNFCVRAMKGIGGLGGKVFLKLGTSLAGGRITKLGAVADEIAEYSKITLNLKTPPTNDPKGLAREFVSSLGVRNLTRDFLFQGQPLFGPHQAYAPQGNDKHGRIEPVELGQLLPVWEEVDPSGSLLAELVRTDNGSGGEVYDRLDQAMNSGDRDDWLRRRVHDYIGQRGNDLRHKCAAGVENKDGLGKDSPLGESGDSDWLLGLKRTEWLLTGKASYQPGCPDGILPQDFPLREFPRIVLGSVAIFSELALRLAHAVATLYNVYRRGTFDEVILSGGVLAGSTGKLVVRQAEAFMEKYYDKIYGKHLPRGSIKLAGAGNPEITGPLGAAMSANRRHKLASVRLIHSQLDAHIRQMGPSGELDPRQFLADHPSRVSWEVLLAYLDFRVADATLTRRPESRVIYTRVL